MFAGGFERGVLLDSSIENLFRLMCPLGTDPVPYPPRNPPFISSPAFPSPLCLSPSPFPDRFLLEALSAGYFEKITLMLRPLATALRFVIPHPPHNLPFEHSSLSSSVEPASILAVS